RAAGCGIARLPCCPPRPWVVPARPEDALTDARMTPVPGPRVTCPMLDRPDPEYVPPSVSVAFDVRADPSALYAGFTTTHPFVYCRASAADWLPAAPSRVPKLNRAAAGVPRFRSNDASQYSFA